MSAPKTTKRPGRPKKSAAAPEAAGVTGVRFPTDLLAEIDARVDELNAAGGPGRTTRSSLIVHLVREGLSRKAP
jgi:metal-responsive CopG/Arc/MetJ family transcriptional regulator